MREVLALLLAALMLVSCDDADQPGPGGVAHEDAKALDEAAAKLDAENADSADQR
jgi:hypothetical protein